MHVKLAKFFSSRQESAPKYEILQCSLLELSVLWIEVYATKITPQTIMFCQAYLYLKMKGNTETSRSTSGDIYIVQ